MEQVTNLLKDGQLQIPTEITEENLRDLVVFMAIIARNNTAGTGEVRQKMINDILAQLDNVGLGNRVLQLISAHTVESPTLPFDFRFWDQPADFINGTANVFLNLKD